MEHFIAPSAGALRAARKPVAVILAVLAMAAIPAHGAKAQSDAENTPQTNTAQTNVVNVPAQKPATSNNAANNAAPSYNPGDPLYVDSQKILQNQQQAAQNEQQQEPQAIAPVEVLTAEMQLLNRRMSLCEGVAACSTRDRLQILTDASNALHEGLLRIGTVCTIMSADSCLSQQYAQLQQWTALNVRMAPMLQSVTSDAGNAQSLLISQGSPPTASALNNMMPAAGDPAVIPQKVVPKP